jgi:hypothetical protein
MTRRRRLRGARLYWQRRIGAPARDGREERQRNCLRQCRCHAAATPLHNASIATDPVIYPPPDVRQRLFVQTEDSAEQTRAIIRIWQEFKTAQ